MDARARTLKFTFLVVCLEIFSFRGAYAADSQTIAGAIVSVKDVATIVSGASGAKRQAHPGDSIYTHDVVTTSDAGGVKILLKDHSVVDLGSATVFKVDQYSANGGADRQISSTMTQGTVRGVVSEKITGNGKFHLKTPTATMGVRGTEFVVDAPPAQAGQAPQATKVTVLQGKVELAPSAAQLIQGGNKVSIGAGQQVTAAAGAAIPKQAITLTPAALGKISSSSKVADNTFTHAVVIATASNKISGETSQKGESHARAPASSGAASGLASTSESPSSGGGGGGAMILADIASGAQEATSVGNAPPPPNVIQVVPGPQAQLKPVQVVNGFSHVTINIH